MPGLADRQNSCAKLQRTFSPPQGGASVHLDALRGLAAFSVLLAHWRSTFFVELGQIPGHGALTSIAYIASNLGHQWVMVFFVLSGYLVGGSVLRSVEMGRWSWREYLLTRMTRLYIVLLPALGLGAALDWMRMRLPDTGVLKAVPGAISSASLDAHSTLTLGSFFGNAAFLEWIKVPGLQVVRNFGSNIPLWSLSFEFWYYIAFPMAVLAFSATCSRRRRLAYGLALPLWAWFVGPNIVAFSIPWLLGVAIHYVPRVKESRLWMRRGSIGAALALLTSSFVFAQARPSWVTDFLTSECAALLIWVMISCATASTPKWYAQFSQRAARSSYTLYLVHLPLLVFLKVWLRRPAYLPSWHAAITTAAVLVVVVAYTQLIYEVFEKHTDELRQWLKAHSSRGDWTLSTGWSQILPSRFRVQTEP